MSLEEDSIDNKSIDSITNIQENEDLNVGKNCEYVISSGNVTTGIVTDYETDNNITIENKCSKLKSFKEHSLSNSHYKKNKIQNMKNINKKIKENIDNLFINNRDQFTNKYFSNKLFKTSNNDNISRNESSYAKELSGKNSTFISYNIHNDDENDVFSSLGIAQHELININDKSKNLICFEENNICEEIKDKPTDLITDSKLNNIKYVDDYSHCVYENEIDVFNFEQSKLTSKRIINYVDNSSTLYFIDGGGNTKNKQLKKKPLLSSLKKKNVKR